MRYEYQRFITHRCGHTEKHTLYCRNHKEADFWAVNLRKTVCFTCRDLAKEKAEDY